MCRSEEPQDKLKALRQTRREETVSTGKKAADCLAPDEAGLQLPASRAACGRAVRSDGNASTSRLVIVSNRVADPDQDGQAGGLVVALDEIFRVRRGLWFGWSGQVRRDADGRPAKNRKAENVDLVTLDLTPREYQDCYLGYANRCLWPILHYRTDLVEFRHSYAEAYQAVNRRFAEALAPLLREDDLIWVHDYHLIPLAREMRRLGCRHRIGFFLHVPFPPKEVFASLPGYEEILSALVAYDLLGFQTETDKACFLSTMEGLAGARADAHGWIDAFGQSVQVGVFPVGIDVDGFAELAMAPKARYHVEKVLGALQDRDLIIGVDRLDYTKGLSHRFAAYRNLLERVPEWRNKVSLLQIAPLSRQELGPYAITREELDRLSGEINGVFADLDWTPIRYHVKPLARSTLAALFRASRVGLVTPLRDGMNLVAKEFVAAQDSTDPGVLVLSRFAGAAEGMKEALIVNPHDVDGTADAINLALAMPLDERVARHDALLQRLRKQDAQAWHRAFIDRLAAGAPAPSASLLEADARTPSTAALCVGSQPTSHRDKEAPSSDQFLDREYEA